MQEVWKIFITDLDVNFNASGGLRINTCFSIYLVKMQASC